MKKNNPARMVINAIKKTAKTISNRVPIMVGLKEYGLPCLMITGLLIKSSCVAIVKLL